jgi:hypothetical protein
LLHLLLMLLPIGLRALFLPHQRVLQDLSSSK